MLSFWWPILLVVFSNTVYHICAKSMPSNVNPFASLTITYVMGAVVSLILYFVLNRGSSLIKEYHNINWTSFALGLAIVGLEVGFMYAYKVGWTVGTASVTMSSMLAVVLVVVGYLLFKEHISWNKVVGVVICLVGLVFINK